MPCHPLRETVSDLVLIRGTMKRFLIHWAIGGFLVPVVVLIVHMLRVGLHKVPGSLIVLIWPSSIMTMAIQNQGIGFAIVVLTISITINIILYSAVGAAFWWFRRFCQ